MQKENVAVPARYKMNFNLPKGADALYAIDPDEVVASVARRIAQQEKFKTRDKALIACGQMNPWDGLEDHYQRCVVREREHYGSVMVGRFPDEPASQRYWLCYAGQRNTGGFRTLQEAALWFVRDGR